jgi:hypothetical protein
MRRAGNVDTRQTTRGCYPAFVCPAYNPLVGDVERDAPALCALSVETVLVRVVTAKSLYQKAAAVYNSLDSNVGPRHGQARDSDGVWYRPDRKTCLGWIRRHVNRTNPSR